MTQTVRDVMTKTVVAAREDTPFKELVALMHEWRVSALPVLDVHGTIVGVVSEADLLLKEDPEVLSPHFVERRARRIERGKAIAVLASELMSAPAVTIEPDARLAEAAHRMHERNVKRLFVVDAQWSVLGVVSRVDLLRAFLRDDREIGDDIDALIRSDPDLEPGAVSATVADGVVLLQGEVERRTMAPDLVARARAIDGVVCVHEHLTWQYDDTVTAGYGAGWTGF